MRESKSRLFASYNKFQPVKCRVVFCSSPSLLHLLSHLLPQLACSSPLSSPVYYWHALACHLHFLLLLSSIFLCQSSPLPVTPHPICSAWRCCPDCCNLISCHLLPYLLFQFCLSLQGSSPPPLSPSLFLSSIPVYPFLVASCCHITSLLTLLPHQYLPCPISSSVAPALT